MTAVADHPAARSVRLVALWVRCYTAGLPAEVRAERRDEIASDLWEQAHDLRNVHAGAGGAVSAEIVARGALGVPADLSWRLERSRLARMPGWAINGTLAILGRCERGARWLGRRGLPGITSSVAAVIGLIGLLVIVTAPTNNSGTPVNALLWWGSLLLLAAGAVALGGRVVGSRPRRGAALVIGGSALFGLLLWMTVVAPIAALALGWRSALRVPRGGAGVPDIGPGGGRSGETDIR